MRIYLNTLLCQDPETWGGLEESVKSFEESGLGSVVRLAVRTGHSGYGSVSPSSVTSTSTTGVSARKTTKRVAHHVARAEPEQPQDRQHPERLHQVGQRLAEVVRRTTQPRCTFSVCAAAITYGASITHFDPPDGTNTPSTAE